MSRWLRFLLLRFGLLRRTPSYQSPRYSARGVFARVSVKEYVLNKEKFFENLGQRAKKLRIKCGYSQEDMISFGFSARHWQQIEAGRAITVTTLLRICEVFHVSVGEFVNGLDRGIYQK